MPYLDSACSSRVENAVRYCPNYPSQLIDYLYTDGGYSRESVIADIGSRTGTLARLLLERGSRVVAIEPDDLLRMTAERLLSDEFQRFVSIKGTGYDTTLCDDSVHHIVCAHGLNWEDIKKCRSEFLRILKPKGTVTLIWNRPMVERDAFTSEYERLLRRYVQSTEKDGLDRLTNQDFSEFFGARKYRFISMPNQQILDLNGMKGRIMAQDGFPELGEKEYADMMKELCRIFDRYNQSGKVVLRFETEAYTSHFE